MEAKKNEIFDQLVKKAIQFYMFADVLKSCEASKALAFSCVPLVQELKSMGCTIDDWDKFLMEQDKKVKNVAGDYSKLKHTDIFRDILIEIFRLYPSPGASEEKETFSRTSKKTTIH